MKPLNETDRAVLRAMLTSSDQGEIARITGKSTSAVTHSLLRLEKAGIADLTRDGQKHTARLAVLADLEKVEAAFVATLGRVLEPAVSS